MTFEEFNKMWLDAYGYPLTRNRGAEAWADFLAEARSDGLVVKIFNEFAEAYGKMCADFNPHAKDAIPTARVFRQRFFAVIRETRGPAQPSGCTTCGGRGVVFALAPAVDDGERRCAPEDYRTIPVDRAHPFAEAYHCPTCRANAKMYAGHDDLRRRVLEHCVPEVLPVDDPRNRYGVSVYGDAFIRLELTRRYGREITVLRDGAAADIPPTQSLDAERQAIERELDGVTV